MAGRPWMPLGQAKSSGKLNHDSRLTHSDYSRVVVDSTSQKSCVQILHTSFDNQVFHFSSSEDDVIVWLGIWGQKFVHRAPVFRS